MLSYIITFEWQMLHQRALSEDWVINEQLPFLRLCITSKLCMNPTENMHPPLEYEFDELEGCPS